MRKHVLVALLMLLLLIPINFVVTPNYPWWMWVLMGWLPVIAAHTAWAIGLFDRDKDEEES